MADDRRGTPDEHDATSDDGDQTRVPWWSRAPQGAALEVRERSNEAFLVKSFAVIPAMVIAFFLPAPLRPMWIGLVIVGYAVWSLRRLRRPAAPRDAGGAPAVEPGDGSADGDAGGPRTPGP
ncbi:hypothetical protein BFL36_07295 [Clavibacter michiganensis]|uniref:Uncharacterized protein n=1 Tax=Clavibacter michiganensis TaxID=28447 RepID=A0A251YHV4_9MICO|nr:hypothetical protein [Clavibacter michiganensis]OUE23845.1 hypothetical protein BFL36_07295 [Clavibacter michiganensis]